MQLLQLPLYGTGNLPTSKPGYSPVFEKDTHSTKAPFLFRSSVPQFSHRSPSPLMLPRVSAIAASGYDQCFLKSSCLSRSGFKATSRSLGQTLGCSLKYLRCLVLAASSSAYSAELSLRAGESIFCMSGQYITFEYPVVEIQLDL